MPSNMFETYFGGIIMNFGNTILQLRKQKNVTQDEMAAELGLTAAAVSKWENNYTLPDILMLCALADYFGVTTDELLGRNPKPMCAVIAANSKELGHSIAELIKRHGFITKQIYSCYSDAMDAAKADASITHLFSSVDTPTTEDEEDDSPDNLYKIAVKAETAQKVLDGFEIYLKNRPEYETIARNSKLK